MIPDKDLCGKLIVVYLKPNLYMVSLPVDITNSKYARGGYQFNFGFLIDMEWYHLLSVRLLVE